MHIRTRFVPLALTLGAAIACGDPSAPTANDRPLPDQPNAITNGTPTGDAYGAVGNLFADLNGDGSWDYRCTGSLISETVFLTAGHCITEGAVYYITFAPVAFPAPTDLRTSDLISSTTGVRHPDYESSFIDLGVVILAAEDVAALGIEPLPLAPLGYLDALRDEGAWGQRYSVVVGYGLSSYGQGRYVTRNDAVRRFAVIKMQQLGANFLFQLTNAVKAGRGGICYGDSGGPVLVDGLVVGVTSVTGRDLGCHSTAGFARTDTETALAFLDDYVTLP